VARLNTINNIQVPGYRENILLIQNIRRHMLVQDILLKKGSEIFHIKPDATVYEAIRMMSEKDVSALLVINDDKKLEGIISDKDYRNKVALKGRTSMKTYVHDIMTTELITVESRESIEMCMHIMTDKKIRHLPVLDQGVLSGIISIGDTVKAIIDQQKVEINDLKSYITGSYPG
jgi:CBS domain-containing protein